MKVCKQAKGKESWIEMGGIQIEVHWRYLNPGKASGQGLLPTTIQKFIYLPLQKVGHAVFFELRRGMSESNSRKIFN